MGGVRLWLCVGAFGLAGLGLVEWRAHAHDAEHHHHHTHMHRHGDITHTHHHSHDTDDGHAPPAQGDVSSIPDGGEEHHCGVDHGQPDAALATAAPRDARRLSRFESASTLCGLSSGDKCEGEPWTPPRAPPAPLSSQAVLSQLRTIVLLT